MWFQAIECNAVNASILLNLINNNFLTFLTENLPILDPYLPPKSENSLTPVKKMQPASNTSPLASCEGVPPPPPLLGNFHLQLDIDQNFQQRFGHP